MSCFDRILKFHVYRPTMGYLLLYTVTCVSIFRDHFNVLRCMLALKKQIYFIPINQFITGNIFLCSPNCFYTVLQ